MKRTRARPYLRWLGAALALAACSTDPGATTDPGGSTSIPPPTTLAAATTPTARSAATALPDTTTTPTTAVAATTATAFPATTVLPSGDPALGIVVLGTLIDGTGADPIPDGAVAILGDTIAAAGPRTEVEIPEGALVYDLTGATILPGFINAHVHNAYDVATLRTWARAGLTTVRDVGARWEGSAESFFFLRDRLAAFPDAARLLAAGPLVTVPGGYPIAGNNFPSLTVTSPEDAREQIAALVEAGADVIKITLTVGGPPTLTVAETAAIVEAAHEGGIAVTAHLTDPESLEAGLAGGIDEIAHSIDGYLSDELIERMLEQDVGWVSTQAVQRGDGARNLLRFREAGGRVAMGNDAGFLPGVVVGMPMNEIRALEDAGFTPMQIIIAATRDAAYVCRIDDRVGTLESGKIADLFVVAGDPLDDFGVLEAPTLVIHNGVVIRNGD